MGLKANFTQADVEKELQRRAMLIDQAIIKRLQYLGELCLTECRTNKTYMDQTGNLTSSMGYVIIAYGKIYGTHGFNQSITSISSNKGTAIGKDGGATGEQLARELATKYSKGFALIVVAGMNYAAHVEARGYNVLSSAEQLAESQLPKMLADLKSNINKMK